MKPENLYHTGIIVDDIEAAKRWYTIVMGYRFSSTAGEGHEQLVELASGPKTISGMRIAYSLNEPRIELVSAIPGTIWQPTKAGVHHLGYWSEDVDGDLANLLANGAEFEAKFKGPHGGLLWAYCKHPVWGRIELVGTMMKPMMEQWWAADSVQ
jgi:catechol 2,3-dioxygenase-like lactoylglutathione lyase family enzyme